MWDEATETLCDLWFVEAKVQLGLVSALQADYLTALKGLPESRKEIEQERERQQRLDNYKHDLIAYARDWNLFRDRALHFSDSESEPEEPDTPLPQLETVELLTDDEIKCDNERIKNNPTRRIGSRDWSRCYKAW